MLKNILRNLLSPISSVVYRQDEKNSRNLTLHLQKRALDSTAAYIEENMANIASVRGQEAVLAKAIEHVSGDGLFCEFGVFKGHTLKTIGKYTSKKIHGFDSFKGLPEFWIDGFGEKAFELPNVPQFSGNVAIHQGYFEASLPGFLASEKDKFSFVHIDCDLYSSTKTIFDLCAARIKKDCVIVFDEYFNYPGWQNGEFKAFQDFVSANKLTYKYITYNAMRTQVAVQITG